MMSAIARHQLASKSSSSWNCYEENKTKLNNCDAKTMTLDITMIERFQEPCFLYHFPTRLIYMIYITAINNLLRKLRGLVKASFLNIYIAIDGNENRRKY